MIGIVGAIVTSLWSRTLIRDTGFVVHDVPDEHVVDEVRETLSGVDGAGITSLHVRRIRHSTM